MKLSKWDQRIFRADDLTAAYPFAAEILRFYKQLAKLQKALYAFQQDANANRQAKKLLQLAGEHVDFEFLTAKFPEFLSAVEATAPAPIARAARGLITPVAGRWSERLSKVLFGCEADFQAGASDADMLLVLAFLQPYVEFLADHRQHNGPDEASKVCPFCRRKPLVGVLRPEGDGGKRSLICSLCFTEWSYGRIRCPSCGEESVEKLAVYTADQFPHVRVEACDTCRHYIKTVDLTKNGLAVPIVDELATLPLNLWAQEHEYLKLQPNLLGI